VLRYDGETWNLIELPGRQMGREVVAGEDQQIYVASYDTFGWLQTSPDGETVYQELMTAVGLKGKERNVGTVWQVLPDAEGVYFRAETALHFLSYDRKTGEALAAGREPAPIFARASSLYARIDGVGFSRFRRRQVGARARRRTVRGEIPARRDQPPGLAPAGRRGRPVSRRRAGHPPAVGACRRRVARDTHPTSC
jgi:hypothetical protein